MIVIDLETYQPIRETKYDKLQWIRGGFRLKLNKFSDLLRNSSNCFSFHIPVVYCQQHYLHAKHKFSCIPKNASKQHKFLWINM